MFLKCDNQFNWLSFCHKMKTDRGCWKFDKKIGQFVSLFGNNNPFGVFLLTVVTDLSHFTTASRYTYKGECIL